MSGPDRQPDDQDLLAGEYALGVLTPDQALAVESLARYDAAMAESVARWQNRLAPLAETVPKQVPPPMLWRRLALATGLEDAPAVRTQPGAAASPAPSGFRRVWRSPGLWRTTTVASLAIAASLAWLMFAQPVPAGGQLLAALSPYGGPGANYLVRVDARGVATVVAVGDPGTPQGRALELWAVASTGARPVSLGLLPGRGGRGTLAVPSRAGTQLLVSQEPEGGSPTGQPTGPVVYAGQLTGT